MEEPGLEDQEVPVRKKTGRGAVKRVAAGAAPKKNGRPTPPGAAPCHTPADRDLPASRRLLLKRLSRVEGQIRGISRMVGEDRYCIDILTQMAAVHEALRAAGRQILENHMKSCVARAMTSGKPEEAERVSGELGRLLARMSR